jgi:hypothetical protein
MQSLRAIRHRDASSYRRARGLVAAIVDLPSRRNTTPHKPADPDRDATDPLGIARHASEQQTDRYVETGPADSYIHTSSLKPLVTGHGRILEPDTVTRPPSPPAQDQPHLSPPTARPLKRA